MYQPESSNLNGTLNGSLYNTRGGSVPQKHKRSPEPPLCTGAAWLVAREKNAIDFLKKWTQQLNSWKETSMAETLF